MKKIAVVLGLVVAAVATVAVLSALYPLTTIVLARVFLAERLDRHRRVGGVLALAGAALVAVG